MKNKRRRYRRILKIAAAILATGFAGYVLLSVFAPHHLERLGSFLTNRWGSRKTRPIVIATAEKGGHYYRLGNLIKKEMEKNRQKVDVRVTWGSLANIRSVRNKDADFAFIQGALREDKHSRVNFEGLAAVATIGWQYVHILTPKKSTIKEFKDLAGRKVSLGAEESGNAALGRLVFDYFQPLSRVQTVYSDISRIKEDFRAGKMAAFFTVYDLHAPVLEAVTADGDYRLVPIPEAEAIAYTIPGCFAAVLPHSLYGPNRDIPPGTPGNFATLKVKTLLITRRGMNSYVVRSLLETLYSARFIKQSLLPELNEKGGREVFDLPLHPEADRFYRRNDPVTSDKYEIGSALLAGLLFIVSTVSYLINRYKARQRQRKKKNIIPYFEELLQYSREMAHVDDIDQLKDLLDQMMAMQRRAEKEWLEGKLDTEHIENLYAIYGIRCENAFHKMTLLQSIKNRELLEQILPLLQSREEKASKKQKAKKHLA